MLQVEQERQTGKKLYAKIAEDPPQTINSQFLKPVNPI